MMEIRADVVIAGAGIAGLMAALKVAPKRAVVVCKNRLGAGAATDWAQGGIAAALGPDDSPALHSLDTQKAGAGISDRAIIDILTRDAPARIEELLELGAHFDREAGGALSLGREAAHNRRRIVRAGGDATGHEILATLVRAVRAAPHITVLEHTAATALLRDGDRVCGMRVYDTVRNESISVIAPATVLATGGCGHLYSRTTNPAEACGDGIALAARAGAVLSDLEFVQFHPTAIDVGLDPMPLATEALRGEGAILINARGERFLTDVHPDAELAPRDVVARAIYEQRKAGPVFLDTRAAIGESIRTRFPTVARACYASSVDPVREPIPVAPAAHYHMGGIAVDAWGRSSLPGLWACGEVAASGMHGANRLASNSLLEALGFATRVADDITAAAAPPARLPAGAAADGDAQTGAPEDDRAVMRLRSAMYEHAGLVRHDAGLRAALQTFDDLRSAGGGAQLRTMLDVAELIARAALARTESRGSHFRSDFPAADAALAKRSFRTMEGAA